MINTVHAQEVEKPVEVPKPEPKISNAKSLDEWISMLEKGESERRTYLKVWDVHSYSYGCLQFKWDTLEQFTKKFGFRTEITEKDLYNCQLQKQTAKAMIRSDYSLWQRWYNVSLKIGLPPK